MTGKEATEYLNNFSWFATKLGLSRIKELMRRLGNPEKGLKFIHVAGSNGKGSTCSMLERILRAAGYKTGLYISPYIQEFAERIQVNGVNIDDESLGEITGIVKAAADGLEDQPSHFELITAIAMLYYRKCACDVVVLEVGMGGEFDATNIIEAPVAAVLTNIGLEHTEYLGNTLTAIAETKSGIIKTGSEVICYKGAPEVTEVVKRICAERLVPFHQAEPESLKLLSADLTGQTFEYRGGIYKLALAGSHQIKNTSVVLETVDCLRRHGFRIDDEAVREGLRLVRWPARFEVLRRDPLFILDGGHNPQCAEALTDCLRQLLPGQKVVFIIGILGNKDYERVLDIVTPFAVRFICIKPDNPKALEPEQLAEIIRKRGYEAAAAPDTPAALKMAEEEKEHPVVAFGSLYSAGDIRTLFGFRSGE